MFHAVDRMDTGKEILLSTIKFIYYKKNKLHISDQNKLIFNFLYGTNFFYKEINGTRATVDNLTFRL